MFTFVGTVHELPDENSVFVMSVENPFVNNKDELEVDHFEISTDRRTAQAMIISVKTGDWICVNGRVESGSKCKFHAERIELIG